MTRKLIEELNGWGLMIYTHKNTNLAVGAILLEVQMSDKIILKSTENFKCFGSILIQGVACNEDKAANNFR